MGLEREGEGDEFEVSLELSIGGCYGKSINVVEGGKNRDDPHQENVPRSDFSCCRRDLEKKRKLEEDEVPRISASNWDNNGGCKVSGGSNREAHSCSPHAFRSNVIKRLKTDNSNFQIQPYTPEVHCTAPNADAQSLPFTKPPKPQNHKTRGGPTQQMPCVTTKGNGPHGKTVTGFLCKYTKSEVSIVCVCHGRFFSPAEFVEHGGGVNVVNPLRHITIVNSVKR